MIDKSREIISTLILKNDRLNFIGSVEGNEPISIDYIPPLGDNLGYTSLELLLLSFTSCLGTALLTFLRKMGKSVSGFEISAKGLRYDDHPTGFRAIQLKISLVSDNISESDLRKLVALSEEKYCPVWAMINGNVMVEIEYDIKKTYAIQL